MGTIVAILSQLFWGVTAGALSGTLAALLKLFAIGGGLAGSGYAIFNWRRLHALLAFRRR